MEPRQEGWTESEAASELADVDIESDNKPPVLDITTLPVKQYYVVPISTNSGMQSDNDLRTAGPQCKTLKQEDTPDITDVHGKEPTFPCLHVKQTCPAAIAIDPCNENKNVLPTVHYKTLKQEDSPSIGTLADDESIFPYLEVKQSFPAPVTSNTSIQNDNDLPTVHCETIKEEESRRVNAAPGEESTFPYMELNQSYPDSIARDPGIQSGNNLPTVHCETIKEEDDHNIHLCVHDIQKMFDSTGPDKQLSVKGQPPFECAEGGKTFTHNQDLTLHLRKHYRKKSFECTLCERRFIRIDFLRKHRRIHKRRPYVCTFCEKRFSAKPSLMRHIRAFCRDKHDNNLATQFHRRVGQRPKSLRYMLCCRDFSRKIDRHRHPLYQNRRKPFRFVLCGRQFSCKEVLNKRLQSYKDKLFTCTICGKDFAHQGHFRSHILIHSGEKPYKCTLCGKGFAQQGTLKRHVRIHSGEKPYKCSLCGKGFARQGSLKSHLYIHTEEKPYKCTLCAAGFARQGDLKRHLRIHSGEKSYKCTLCGKGFNQPGNLKSHLRIHSGEKPVKPHRCTLCGKGFTRQGALKIHFRIHSGERPYECTICGKGFAQKHHLEGHLHVHTGKKHYQCPMCEKSYSAKSSLDCHIRVHAGEKPYECSVCGEQFSSNDDLKGHTSNHSRHDKAIELLTRLHTKGAAL